MITVCNGCRKPCEVASIESDELSDYGDGVVVEVRLHDVSDCCERDFHHVLPSHAPTAFVCTACLRVGPVIWGTVRVDHELVRTRVSCCCLAEVQRAERKDVA